jgi:hypothetical protein
MEKLAGAVMERMEGRYEDEDPHGVRARSNRIEYIQSMIQKVKGPSKR